MAKRSCFGGNSAKDIRPVETRGCSSTECQGTPCGWTVVIAVELLDSEEDEEDVG